MQFWKRIFEIYHANESLLEKHVEFFGTSAFVGRFLASSVLTTDYQGLKRPNNYADPLRIEEYLKFIESNELDRSDLEAVFNLIIYALKLCTKNTMAMRCSSGSEFLKSIMPMSPCLKKVCPTESSLRAIGIQKSFVKN
jgi:hypothetical protein